MHARRSPPDPKGTSACSPHALPSFEQESAGAYSNLGPVRIQTDSTIVFRLEVAEFGNANNERSDILQPYGRLRCLQNFQLSEWLSHLLIEETRAFAEADATASGVMHSRGGGPSPSVRRPT